MIFKKNVTIVLLLYLLTRITFMFHYPIFNDEALSLRQGRIMIETPYHFYTLQIAGKQPLLFWLDGLLTFLFPDPLKAARLISTFAGIVSVYIIYSITKLLYDRGTAIISSVLYAVSPLNIFFDGLVIHDSVLLAIFSFICLKLLRLGKEFRWSHIIWTALAIGFGLWIKSTSIIFYLVSLVIFIFLWVRHRLTLRRLFYGQLVIVGIILVVLLPLITRPEFAGVYRMQQEYGLTFTDLVKFPYGIWLANIRDTFLVYLGYLSPFVIIWAIVGAIQQRKNVYVQQLLIFLFVSLAILVVAGKILHSRYVLFTVVPFFPLAASQLVRHRTLLGLTVVTMGIASFVLIFSPSYFFHMFPRAWVYATEAGQYVDGWPSGYGVMEALAFVDKHRDGKQAFIGVRWDSGNPEDTILLYAPHLPGITTSFIDKRLENFNLIINTFRNKPMYLITRAGQRGGLDDHLTFLARFPKPSGIEAVEVYQYQP